MTTRRKLLQSSGAALGFLAAPHAAFAACEAVEQAACDNAIAFERANPNMRVRFNVACAGATPHLNALRKALIIMRGLGDGAGLAPELKKYWTEIRATNTRPSPDPEENLRIDTSDHPYSLGRQARIHLDNFGTIHRSWQFFPWHRAQLIFFEAIVAKLSGFRGFAMPYWDFTDCRTSKAPEFLFASPFNVPRRSGARDKRIYEARLQASLGIDDTAGRGAQPLANLNTAKWWHFMGFPIVRDDDADLPWFDAEWPEMVWGGTAPVDAGSHNFVHRQLGGIRGEGVFGGKRSPADPVFWFHHCNLDRIWASWQQRHRSRETAPRTDPSFFMSPAPRIGSRFLDQEFGGMFVAPHGTSSALHSKVATLTARDVIDFQHLGYRYDGLFDGDLFDIDNLGEGAWTEKAVLSGKKLSPAGSTPARIGVAGTKWIDLDAGLLPVDTPDEKSIVSNAVAVLQMRREGLENCGLRVFVHASEFGPQSVQSFADYLTPVGMRHGGHGERGSQAFIVDVTQAMARAVRAGARTRVGISIVPVAEADAEAGADGQTILFERASLEIEAVRLKRGA